MARVPNGMTPDPSAALAQGSGSQLIRSADRAAPSWRSGTRAYPYDVDRGDHYPVKVGGVSSAVALLRVLGCLFYSRHRVPIGSGVVVTPFNRCIPGAGRRRRACPWWGP
jgi:hypothetical protein